LNEGGLFAVLPAWSSGLANQTYGVALGDVDGDGDLDLVCGHKPGGPSLLYSGTLYLNEGGLFAVLPAWSSGHLTYTNSVTLGDVDGDGDLELVCGNPADRSTLYENEGGLFATLPAWSSSQTRNTSVVVLGDVDGDGDLDLVCGNSGNIPESNTLYLNEGGLFAAVPAWSSGQANRTNGMALGDVDGDGDLDLVCGNHGDANTLYLNEGGLFAAVPAWSSGQANHTNGVALGDVDSDGDLDLVCGNLGESNTLYLNEGGLFAAVPAWSSGQTNRTDGVALGDVDGDGDLDLVCGNYQEKSTLYLNEGGLFATLPVWSSGQANWTLGVALGDVDGDGDLDLVCGNDGESNILYFNEGGLFATLPAWSSGQTNSTRGVALGDVDADGDLDLICGNGPIFGQSNTLYFNEGGLFATLPAWSSGPTDRTRGVVLGDVDADGDVDLVCGNAGRSTLYRNERNPVLKGDPAAPQNHLPNNSAFATAVSFAHADTNLYRVSARLFDVESDPVWIVAEYQFDGAPQWFPAVLDNQPSGIGPLPTSPDGVAHTIHWDVSTVPFDSRDVILRLRVVSVPQRVSPMQHIASHTIRIGSIEPVRGELAVSTTSLSFTTVTLGDTTSAALSLWNRGKSLIRVTNLQPTSTNTHIDQSAPFSIASGGRVDLTLFYAPLDAGSDPGALRIESDGLLTPIVIVDLDAVVRRVNFIVTNLYPQGEISQGVELSIAAVMADSVHADSALVFFRKGGAKAFRDVRLTQIADPVNEQYVGGVPADSISSRGVEYYVKVFNGAASPAGEGHSIPKCPTPRGVPDGFHSARDGGDNPGYTR
jgi:hypothetical protein